MVCSAVYSISFPKILNQVSNYLFSESQNKRGLAFYTLRDVHPGEELCIAYSDETVSLNERIESLQKDWFFVCQCTKCSREIEASSWFNASSKNNGPRG
ncbi:hypothetical protein BYT27DRAFT_7155749 [Phlegmacium glaucopus]|nr:hypothetical protein BYT27DRAFT_7155749 [Phlegmacium glaucopus]